MTESPKPSKLTKILLLNVRDLLRQQTCGNNLKVKLRLNFKLIM